MMNSESHDNNVNGLGNPKFPRKLKHENKSPLLLSRIGLCRLLATTDQ